MPTVRHRSADWPCVRPLMSWDQLTVGWSSLASAWVRGSVALLLVFLTTSSRLRQYVLMDMARQQEPRCKWARGNVQAFSKPLLTCLLISCWAKYDMAEPRVQRWGRTHHPQWEKWRMRSVSAINQSQVGFRYAGWRKVGFGGWLGETLWEEESAKWTMCVCLRWLLHQQRQNKARL